MDFKDLLTKRGLNLDKVMVMRHRPTEPRMRRVLPWLAATILTLPLNASNSGFENDSVLYHNLIAPYAGENN